LLPRLHRHALESVFAFCTRAEVVTVNAVSREWQAAVLSMAPLQWRFDSYVEARLTQICKSPLRRHVSAVNCSNGWFDTQFLPLLSERMPHLRELIAAVYQESSQTPLLFPPQLVTLELCFELPGDGLAPMVAPLNAAITTVAGLVRLETLRLEMPKRFWEACSLEALAHAPRLRDLSLSVHSAALTLSDAQVDELRALSQLESLQLERLDASLLSRLLAPPHALRWRSLAFLPAITEAVVPLLLSLPLHTLDAAYPGLEMLHWDWLAQLPGLTKLTLCSSCEVPLDVDRILQAISGCAQLRSLTLFDSMDGLHFTSAQLSASLPRLPQLQSLTLRGARALTTLDFLVQGNLPRSLTALRLEVFYPGLPLSEVKHVREPRELRSLELAYVFDAPLDEADMLLFQPLQTKHMPHLTHFVHSWSA